jgi:hypothetical protein
MQKKEASEGKQTSDVLHSWQSNELGRTFIPFYLISLAVSTRYHYVSKHARETFTH